MPPASGFVLPGGLQGEDDADDARDQYVGGIGPMFDVGDADVLDDEAAMLALKDVVQQTIEKNKARAAKQQAQILEEFKAGAEKRAAALEAVIAKDAKDSAALAKATVTKTRQRLEDRLAQMEALTTKYQQDMAGLWEQYNQEYSGLEASVAQIKRAVENKKQGVKRRIAAVQQENEASLAEARKRADSIKGRAARMPGLAKVLQALM